MTKTYVITGSTSGIGKKLVEIFSNGENIVFAGYRDESKLPSESLSNVIYFYIDMTDRNSIVQAANFIKSKTEHVDVLINVAGCVEAGPIENTDTDRLRKQFDVNVFSHIELSQNLVDVMQDSRIINMSSMASFGHFPFISPYCASKRALDIFFNAFALENHKNIKVISIKPGVVSTPIWRKSVDNNWKHFGECKKYYERELRFLRSNALKNTLSGLPVDEVAKLVKKVADLKNPKSSYTVGKDAKFAQILSLLPQDWINSLVRFGMRKLGR